MKKLRLFIISFLSLGLLLAPATASAAYNPFDQVCNSANNTSTSTVCKSKDYNSNPLIGPDGIITRVIQLINFAIGVAAVVVIVIAGIRFIVSQGDANTVSGARNAIMYAVVGLFVALAAQLIVIFVLKRL